MKASDKKRLQTIFKSAQDVSFDKEGASFTFVDRLARENGWSPFYAERVVEEYRRFAAIAALGLREVTPSDQVDQAWHLHLTYTRNYWGIWSEALGVPLHHGPTSGGSDESIRYLDSYRALLQIYQSGFDRIPPKEIWPEEKERFREPARFVRLDTSRYIIWNRPWA